MAFIVYSMWCIPMIVRRLNARSLQLYVAVLLLLVGALMLLGFLAMADFLG